MWNWNMADVWKKNCGRLAWISKSIIFWRSGISVLDASEQPVVRVVEPVAIFIFRVLFFISTRTLWSTRKMESMREITIIRRYSGWTASWMWWKWERSFRFAIIAGLKRANFANACSYVPGRTDEVRFYYRGVNVEAVLDRLPTARVVSHTAGEWLVEAEVYGKEWWCGFWAGRKDWGVSRLPFGRKWWTSCRRCWKITDEEVLGGGKLVTSLVWLWYYLNNIVLQFGLSENF